MMEHKQCRKNNAESGDVSKSTEKEASKTGQGLCQISCHQGLALND